MKALALVIGGYVNGYSMIQELSEMGVENIGLLFYHDNQPAKYSNLLSDKMEINRDTEVLCNALYELKNKYDKLVLFPCDEYQIDQLNSLYSKISPFCFLPFNPENIDRSFDKQYQYEICQRVGVPFPKSLIVKKGFTIGQLEEFMFPVIVKPRMRYEIDGIFRIKRVHSLASFEDFFRDKIENLLKENCEFLVSEMVAGDTNHGLIYAYTCYRSPINGNILNEWVGRKESQFPDHYGVFSTASSRHNQIVLQQGRKLVKELNAYGIVEPEFKYDVRDGKFKLMEVNFRSMMWHRIGSLAGVKLQFSQWMDALGNSVPKYEQGKDGAWFTYLNHEIYNVIARPGYIRYFKRNVLRRHIVFALWNKEDPKPFLLDLFSLLRIVPKAMINRFRNA